MLENVPLEIIIEIMGFLEPQEIFQISRTCKLWKVASENDVLFRDWFNIEFVSGDEWNPAWLNPSVLDPKPGEFSQLCKTCLKMDNDVCKENAFWEIVDLCENDISRFQRAVVESGHALYFHNTTTPFTGIYCDIGAKLNTVLNFGDMNDYGLDFRASILFKGKKFVDSFCKLGQLPYPIEVDEVSQYLFLSTGDDEDEGKESEYICECRPWCSLSKDWEIFQSCKTRTRQESIQSKDSK